MPNFEASKKSFQCPAETLLQHGDNDDDDDDDDTVNEQSSPLDNDYFWPIYRAAQCLDVLVLVRIYRTARYSGQFRAAHQCLRKLYYLAYFGLIQGENDLVTDSFSCSESTCSILLLQVSGPHLHLTGPSIDRYATWHGWTQTTQTCSDSTVDQ